MTFQIKVSQALCVVLLWAATPLFASSASSEIAYKIARASTLAQSLFESCPIPGMTVAISDRSGLLWSEAFGSSDLELNVEATTNTRFRLASVSKVVTATALARLVDAGDIDLDASVKTYIPDLPPHYEAITPRLLAGHVSGIRGYVDGDIALDTSHFETVRAAVSVFVSDPLVSQPGTEYHYSPFGYVLLSAVLEVASEQAFRVLMKSVLFDPLGMQSSDVDDPRAIVANRSRFYETVAANTFVNARFVDPGYKLAAGGLLSTSEDLARLGTALLGDDFLSPRVRDALFTSQLTAEGDSTGVGLGWRICTDCLGEQVFHHAGNMPGARSVIALFPRHDLVVVINTNVRNIPHLIEDSALLMGREFWTEASGTGLHELPALNGGAMKYTGTYVGQPISGTISLSPAAGRTYSGVVTVPESMTGFFEANGLAAASQFELKYVRFENSDVGTGALVTPFGLTLANITVAGNELQLAAADMLGNGLTLQLSASIEL